MPYIPLNAIPPLTMFLGRRHFVELITAGLMGSAANIAKSQAAIAAPNWSYQGERGPNHWGELSPDYHLCANGQHQSPVELDNLIATPVDWHIDYQPSPLTLTNNGHTIYADYSPGSTLTLDGNAFELIQFHFHDPSEHTRSHRHQAMEIHFVHRQQETQALAVLGVLVQLGTANPALAAFWPTLPLQAGQSVTLPQQQVNAAQLLPDDTTPILRYSGSLTTPPCSEAVTWLILENSITASAEQIDRFKALMGENARPTQAHAIDNKRSQAQP